MGDQGLLQHLIITTTTTTNYTDVPATTTPPSPKHHHEPSNSAITFRILSIFFVGLISIWANHEASKGFDISIVNNARDTPAGRQFDLFYVSNDEAIRMILKASDFVADFLYSRTTPTNHKKKVNRVILIFGSHNFTNNTKVSDHEYVIKVNPSLLGGKNVQRDLMTAIYHAMAKIWLWGEESNVPPRLVDGIAKYIELMANSGGFESDSTENKIIEPIEAKGSELCWDDGDPKVVASFLTYCEKHNNVFIQRLSLAMKDEWKDRMVDDALGMSAKQLCDYYRKSHNSTTTLIFK